MLKDMLSRLAFIGCSTTTSKQDLLGRFGILESSLLQLLGIFLAENVSFQALTVVLSGIYAAMLHFRGSCSQAGLIGARHGLFPSASAWKQDLSLSYDFSAADRGGQTTTSWTWPSGGYTTQAPEEPQLFGEYLKLALSIVGRLYRQATQHVTSRDGSIYKELSTAFVLPKEVGSAQEHAPSALYHQDRYLHQLASLAAFVVRDLDESEQQTTEIYREAFDLFYPRPETLTGRSMFNNSQVGRLDVLSMGILQGLFPAAMANLVRRYPQDPFILQRPTADTEVHGSPVSAWGP